MYFVAIAIQISSQGCNNVFGSSTAKVGNEQEDFEAA
jgi:hypothetical protein